MLRQYTTDPQLESAFNWEAYLSALLVPLLPALASVTPAALSSAMRSISSVNELLDDLQAAGINVGTRVAQDWRALARCESAEDVIAALVTLDKCSSALKRSWDEAALHWELLSAALFTSPASESAAATTRTDEGTRELKASLAQEGTRQTQLEAWHTLVALVLAGAHADTAHAAAFDTLIPPGALPARLYRPTRFNAILRRMLDFLVAEKESVRERLRTQLARHLHVELYDMLFKRVRSIITHHLEGGSESSRESRAFRIFSLQTVVLLRETLPRFEGDVPKAASEYVRHLPLPRYGAHNKYNRLLALLLSCKSTTLSSSQLCETLVAFGTQDCLYLDEGARRTGYRRLLALYRSRDSIENSALLLRATSAVLATRRGTAANVDEACEMTRWWHYLRLRLPEALDAQERDALVECLGEIACAAPDDPLFSAVDLVFDAQHRLTTLQILARLAREPLAPPSSAGEEPLHDICQVLRDDEDDWAAAFSLIEQTQPAHYQDLAEILMAAFSGTSELPAFLGALIEVEVEREVHEAALFRGNSFAVKLVNLHLRTACQLWLERTLQPLVELVLRHSETHQNHDAIELAEAFLAAWEEGVDEAPDELKNVCALLRDAVAKRFPDAKSTIVGGFLFLRVLNPATVFPESVGIELPQQDGLQVRRTLVSLGVIVRRTAQLTCQPVRFSCPSCCRLLRTTCALARKRQTWSR